MGAGPAEYPQSPCVGLCRIGDDGLCEGCLRTLDEIARWSLMADADRAAVYEQLAKREPVCSPQNSG